MLVACFEDDDFPIIVFCSVIFRIIQEHVTRDSEIEDKLTPNHLRYCIDTLFVWFVH